MIGIWRGFDARTQRINTNEINESSTEHFVCVFVLRFPSIC